MLETGIPRSSVPPETQTKAARWLVVHYLVCLVTLVVFFHSLLTLAAASTLGPEYGLFKSLCTVVEIPESELEPIDRKLVDQLTSAAIRDRVRQSGLTFPIEHGQQCFPGKVGSAPDQLSVRFNAVLARGLGSRAPVILSLTAHDFFRDYPRSPFDYPTKILFCPSRSGVPRCVAGHISQFFGETTLKIILRAQELLKGEKR